MEKERAFAVDIIKFLAAFIITWSHFEKPLGDYSALATGGAFGDTIFFFVSGYTLLLSKKGNGFFNWYKRRINRIYPTVFAWALLTSLFLKNQSNMLEVLLSGGGFFVTCIMVFYLLFYPVKKYMSNHMGGAILLAFSVQLIAYFFVNHEEFLPDYLWQWSSYFIAMLVGAMVGRKQMESGFDTKRRIKTCEAAAGVVVSAALYYILMYIDGLWHFASAFRIIPLLGFGLFLFHMCNADFCKSYYNKPWCNLIIMTIGSLCLEIYIVQIQLLTDKMNFLFPLNLLLMFVIIFSGAYILKVASNLWSQTFSDRDYNWKSMLKVY